MGPLANQPQYEKVLSFLSSAPAQGATVAAGGSRPPSSAATSCGPPC